MADPFSNPQNPFRAPSAGGFGNALRSAFQLPGQLLKNFQASITGQNVNQQLQNTYSRQGITAQNPTVQRPNSAGQMTNVPIATPTVFGSQPNTQAPIRPPTPNSYVNTAQASTGMNSNMPGNGGTAWQPTTDQYGNSLRGNTNTQNPLAVNPDINIGSPNLQPQQDNSQQTPDRFAQLTALENAAAQYNQPTQDEQDTMQQLGNMLSSRDLGLAKINNNPEPLQLLTGQSDFLAKQAEAQTQPLQAKLGILQARRQAAVQGYQQALGAEQAKLGFSQPVSLGLGQALVNPSTGQTVAGNASYTGGSNGGAGSLIDSLAQQVNSGAAYNDVVAQLPSAALAPALLQAIMKQNPNFNITQSNQNAGARAQQLNQNVTLVQPLKLAMNTALDHIKGLQDVVNKANYSDSGIINNIRTGISDNISSDQNIKSLQSQIGLVREEVAKVLGGGTATDSARADANAIIPMNISPSQFQAVIGQVQQRMQEKIDEYSKLADPSQYGGGQSNQSSGSLYSF